MPTEKANSGLVTNARILVSTQNGEREIQLCVGDITRLSTEEKVDVILVSAFPNDYALMRGTVIGALKYNLGIDVKKLYIDHMKQDLRKHFHCWISNNLPKHVPYKQLICFERSKRETQKSLLESVQEIFRAMMPLFNNQSKTVITPLLATGMQHVDRADMLNAMITTAVNWMQMGLPLQKLKIVVYARDPQNISSREKSCLEKFLKLKKVVEKTNTKRKEPAITSDVFVIHSQEDVELFNVLKSSLRQTKNGMKPRISTVQSVKTSADSWQHDVFQAMMSSSCIVPFLSQSFLESESCIDQFNIALCCNRLTRRDSLCPICLERFQIPLYMASVQWLNCKERDIEKISNAAIDIMGHISRKGLSVRQKQYDVFISYCHRNIDQGKAVLNVLKEMNPDLKIFFDYAELKTGVSWQQTLYSSLDSSRCVISLVSSDYAKSLICIEEYNIALSKHLSKMADMKLIPLLLENANDALKELVDDFPVLDASSDNFDGCVHNVCDAVCAWLKSDVHDEHIFGPKMERTEIEVLTSKRRQELFETYYKYNASDSMYILDHENEVKQSNVAANSNTCDLFISSSLWDQKYVDFITNRLKNMMPDLKVSDKLKSSESQIVEAKCVLVVLSPNYMKSPKEVDELNLILSKERSAQGRRHMYMIRTEDCDTYPTYVKLIHCDTSLTDEIWEDSLRLEREKNTTVLNEDVVNLLESLKKEFSAAFREVEALALLKAVCDLTSALADQSYYDVVKVSSGLFLNVLEMMRELEGGVSEKVNISCIEEQQNTHETHVYMHEEETQFNDGDAKVTKTDDFNATEKKRSSKSCVIL